MPFPLRGKLVCPRCRRRLCSYTITSRRGLTTIGYRYYRCRSTAGGRAPCKGIQYPAGEVEQLVRDILAESGAWDRLIDDGAAITEEHIEALRAVWTSLDTAAQDRLLPELVESVEIRRRNTELRLTLNARFAAIVSDYQSTH